MTNAPNVGTIGWLDLTVDNAESVRDFYSTVVGWTADPVDMGEYNDFAMAPPGGEAIAGVCHKRGTNEDIPSAWMVYFVVADVDASIEHVKKLGGSVIAGPKSEGNARYAIIKDPAGAVCSLYQAPG